MEENNSNKGLSEKKKVIVSVVGAVVIVAVLIGAVLSITHFNKGNSAGKIVDTPKPAATQQLTEEQEVDYSRAQQEFKDIMKQTRDSMIDGEITDGVITGTDAYGDYGYEELPSEPTEEELEAIIKRVEEEQGIEITGVIEGLDVPKDTSTPTTTPEPTPTPAPVQPTTKPETNGSYEPDKIPSDISGITPPAPDAGRDPTIDQESRDAWLQAAAELDASTEQAERADIGQGGATISSSEKEDYDQFLKDQGVTWDP